jgi:uncharacterized protein YeaO (DUF488 family)
MTDHIRLKRAYEPVSRTDGARVLVERLWPRGLSKQKLKLDRWLRDAGPTTELRQWFDHDPAKWSRFRTRYFRELDSRPESWEPIVSLAKRRRVTLIYSSHDEAHNNAVALREYLLRKVPARSQPRPSTKAHRSRQPDR